MNIASSLLFAADTAQSGGLPSRMQWGLTVAIGTLIIGALGFISLRTRAGIIARATTKEAVRQPIFLLLMTVAVVLCVLNTFIPFFSFGDDVKMLMDCGMATVLICGLLMAVWTSSTAVADEIEGKTAMTLLSKPINRRQFIIGKYVGILQGVSLMMLPVIIILLALIYYKVGYDARESSSIAETSDKIDTVLSILPNMALIFLEVAVLTAVSLVISTRLPMVVNLSITFSIFVIGHLTPVLVEAGLLRLEFVEFMARLIATVLPSLEVFNTQTAVATGTIVPPAYLGLATAYCLSYVGACILLAFILFEDRDLA